MAIQFSVETGTASSNSTSYVTTAEFIQYWENRGVDYTDVKTTLVQGWLNRSSEYLDNFYYDKLKGVRYDDEQALSFPRMPENISESIDSINYPEIYDSRVNRWISFNEIPESVKNAVCELGKVCETESDLYGYSDGIKSKKLGVGSITYNGFHSSGIKEYRPVNAYMSGLIKGDIIRVWASLKTS